MYDMGVPHGNLSAYVECTMLGFLEVGDHMHGEQGLSVIFGRTCPAWDFVPCGELLGTTEPALWAHGGSLDPCW
jgi:hypothetical protein